MISFCVTCVSISRTIRHLLAIGAVMMCFPAAAGAHGRSLLANPAAVKAGTLAKASASPVLSYALTTMTNPVVPGQAAVFTVTVTNLTNAAQSYDLCHVVPEFTRQGGNSAGTQLCTGNSSLSAGTSTFEVIVLTVLSGVSTPQSINLIITDPNDGASVSRNVTVQSTPEVGLALSIPMGTVAPGGSFTTTLTYSNYSASTLSGLQLSAPVPAGASFVAADGGGVLGDDGVVRWAPGPLAAGATGAVHLTLKAIAPATVGLVVVDATLNDSSNDLLADASSALPVYTSPVFSYALTTMTSPAVPGQAAVFTVTVTNLTNAAQFYDLCHVVPEFTQQGGNSAGAQLCTGNSSLSAGTSMSEVIVLTVLSGVSTPPNGALINLTVTDPNDGASVSRNVTVQSTPEVGLALSIPMGTVAPGGSFTTTLTYSNYSASTLSGLQLSAPVPAGASFVAADGGGVLGDDGVVRWAPGPLAAGATGAVHLTLKAIAPATVGLVVVDATLNDSSNDLLADASSALPVYTSPVFSYALTTMTSPAVPGQAAVFTVTVTNLTNAAQFYDLCHVVPEFTQQGGNSAGAQLCTGNSSLSAGTSTSR